MCMTSYNQNSLEWNFSSFAVHEMSYAKRAMNFGMARIKPKLVQAGSVWVFTMGGDFTTPFDLPLKGQSEPSDFIPQET